MALKAVVTAAGAPGGPCIIKALKSVKERELYVVATDVRRDAAGLYLADKRYIVPMGTDPNYVKAMLSICKSEGAEVVLPLSSMELLALSRSVEEFEKVGAKVLVSNYESVRIALSKHLVYEFLESHGLGDVVPRHRLINTYAELREALEDLGFPEKPVVVKPPASKGQRGFRVLIEGLRDFREIYESKPTDPFMDASTFLRMYRDSGEGRELLVMEYLPGKEFTVDALCLEGEPIVVVPRERVKVVQGISVIARVVRNEELIRITESIIKLLRFSYVINVQFKYGPHGRPKLLEINPRVAGTVCATIEAGANLPYLAMKLALNEDFEVPRVRSVSYTHLTLPTTERV